MAERHGSDVLEMSLEAQLWREVCQHLELEESIQRVYSILADSLPIRALSIRRFERNPSRLTTLATGIALGFSSDELGPNRLELAGATADECSELLERGRPTLIDHYDSSLAQLLVPHLRTQLVVMPLRAQDGTLGVATLVVNPDTSLTQAQLAQLEPAVKPLGIAFENDQRLHELARMRAALEADREALLTKLQRHDLNATVIGASAGLAPVMERVEQVAGTDAPVLILGETGSGKEVIARSIHAGSPRAKGPIVRVNCGAIPSELIDSELFGHERGAFTGATSTRKGWFERADGGTLFLDEVGELPPAAQVRLLRVLQDGTLERVGGHQTIAVDVRIVAATHRHLETMVSSGAFREDLWYRMSVFPIRLPALREHMEDLPALAAHFADRAGKRLGGNGLIPTSSDLELLRNYPWPGNVRELGAVIERAAILGGGKRLEVATALGANANRPISQAPPPPPSSPSSPAAPSTSAGLPTIAASSNGTSPASNSGSTPITTLDEAISEHIRRALKACQGRIEGPFGAAKVLGINPHTLRARMRKLGIDWSQFRDATPNAPERG